jgi:hypothetical protein
VRLRATTDELEQARLTRRFVADHGQTLILEAPARRPTRVAGEVTGTKVVPRAGHPSLEVVVDDGSGTVLLVFTGRRHIAGLDPGRGVVVEGVGRRERGQLVLVNPAYTLLP